MRTRWPWLILLLAVGGAIWMLFGAVETLDDGTGEGSTSGAGTAADEEAAWDEAWDAAPRLIGRRDASANGSSGSSTGANANPGAGTGTTAGTAGTDATAATGAVVKFGGIVKGTDGNPVADITVKISGRGGVPLVVTTGPDGRFAAQVAAGRYDLVIRGAGVGGLNLRNYVVDGATGLDIELTLKRTHRLVVELDREGLAIADAQVEATPRERVGGEGATTDAAGAAVFEALVAGSYRLSVTLPSNETIVRNLTLRSDSEIKIKVPPGVVIHGNVENADEGGPVADAEVAAWVRGASGVWIGATTKTDVDGRYELSVPKGPVARFEVVAETFAPWPPRKRIRSVLKTLAGIAKGKEVQRDIQLTHGLTLIGRVSDTEGQGVAGLEISVRPRRSAASTVTTVEDGMYELAGIRPDRYDIVILTEGWFSEQAIRMTVPNLQPGESHTFDISVHRTIEVQGTVLHHSKSPAAGTRVWVTGGGRLLRAAHNAGRTLETFTDDRGWWRITDLPANQRVTIRAALGTLEARPRGIDTAKLPEKPIELVLAPTVTLKGTVVDVTTRSPVPKARVVLRPRGSPGGRTSRSATTDSEGTFEVFELIPGTWELTPARSGFLAAEAHSEDLAGKEGEVAVELYLDPGLTIAGEVMDLQGRYLANTRVYINGTDLKGKRVRRSVNTNARGQFRLTGFERGDYTLLARKNGYRNASVNAIQGGEQRLTVTMTPRNPRR